MNKCPKCGHPLKGYEVFCPNCGADLIKTNRQLKSSGRLTNQLDTDLDRFDEILDISNDPKDWDLDDMWKSLDSVQPSSASSSVARFHPDSSVSLSSSSESSQETTPSFHPEPHLSSRPDYRKDRYQHDPNDFADDRQHVNYVGWWVRSLRHPLQVNADSHPSFALISFGISLILWVLSFRFLINRLINSILTIFFDGKMSANTILMEKSVSHWWWLCILGLLAVSINWIVGYESCNNRFRRIDFWDYGDRLAALTNVGMIFEVGMMVLALNAFYQGAMICFWIAVLINAIGLVVSIFALNPNRTSSKVYTAILAVILVPVLTIVIFECIIQIVI